MLNKIIIDIHAPTLPFLLNINYVTTNIFTPAGAGVIAGVGAKPKKDIHKLGTCDFIEAHRIAKK